AGRGVPSHPPGYHRSAVRDDDRGREPASFGVLQPGRGADAGARASSHHAFGRDRDHHSGAVRLFRQRYGLSGDGATGGGSPGALKRNLVPYLLAVAMGSNIGSVATLTGNPQNMLIGSYSGIAYGTFTRALAPVALAGVVVLIAVLAMVYRKEFAGGEGVRLAPQKVGVDRVLLAK